MPHGSKKKSIIALHLKNPNATATEIAKMAKASLPHTSAIIKSLKEEGKSKSKSVSSSKTVAMGLDIGNLDAELKIQQNKRVIGTMQITQSGIKFKKANAKKNGDRILTWDTISALQKLGLMP